MLLLAQPTSHFPRPQIYAFFSIICSFKLNKIIKKAFLHNIYMFFLVARLPQFVKRGTRTHALIMEKEQKMLFAVLREQKKKKAVLF